MGEKDVACYRESNNGLGDRHNSENNGEVIRLCIPPLTEDRRRELVKQVKAETETSKVASATFAEKQLMHSKRAEKRIGRGCRRRMPKVRSRKFDKYIKQVDDAFAVKEKEIMKV